MSHFRSGKPFDDVCESGNTVSSERTPFLDFMVDKYKILSLFCEKICHNYINVWLLERWRCDAVCGLKIFWTLKKTDLTETPSYWTFHWNISNLCWSTVYETQLNCSSCFLMCLQSETLQSRAVVISKQILYHTSPCITATFLWSWWFLCAYVCVWVFLPSGQLCFYLVSSLSAMVLILDGQRLATYWSKCLHEHGKMTCGVCARACASVHAPAWWDDW